MIDPNIPQDWLTKQLVSGVSNYVDQREREKKITEITNGFVNLLSEWEQVFREIGPEDEIWEFDSPGDYWVSLCGRAGIALVRSGKPIVGVVTEMN